MKTKNSNSMVGINIIAALTIITGVSLSAQPWEHGNGTEGNPYLIEDTNDLYEIGAIENQQYLVPSELLTSGIIK